MYLSQLHALAWIHVSISGLYSQDRASYAYKLYYYTEKPYGAQKQTGQNLLSHPNIMWDLHVLTQEAFSFASLAGFTTVGLWY